MHIKSGVKERITYILTRYCESMKEMFQVQTKQYKKEI